MELYTLYSHVIFRRTKCVPLNGSVSLRQLLNQELYPSPGAREDHCTAENKNENKEKSRMMFKRQPTRKFHTVVNL